jgi:hypothetical protein
VLVCHIQRFDFDCNLVVTQKLIIPTPPGLGSKPLSANEIKALRAARYIQNFFKYIYIAYTCVIWPTSKNHTDRSTKVFWYMYIVIWNAIIYRLRLLVRTNALYRPIRGEADISPDHVLIGTLGYFIVQNTPDTCHSHVAVCESLSSESHFASRNSNLSDPQVPGVPHSWNKQLCNSRIGVESQRARCQNTAFRQPSHWLIENFSSFGDRDPHYGRVHGCTRAHTQTAVYTPTHVYNI